MNYRPYIVVRGDLAIEISHLRVGGGVAKNADSTNDFATNLDPGPLYYSASDVNVIVQIIS